MLDKINLPEEEASEIEVYQECEDSNKPYKERFSSKWHKNVKLSLYDVEAFRENQEMRACADR